MKRPLPINTSPADISRLYSSAAPHTAAQTVPTPQQLLSINDLVPIFEVIILYLPGKSLSHLLSTCSALQLLYFSLLASEARGKVEKDCEDLFFVCNSGFGTDEKIKGYAANVLFIQNLNNRLLEHRHIMQGPNIKDYAEYWGINPTPLLIDQLREDGTSITLLESWKELKSRLLNKEFAKDVAKLRWLEKEMLTEPTKSVIGPHMRQYLRDGLWPLKDIDAIGPHMSSNLRRNGFVPLDESGQDLTDLDEDLYATFDKLLGIDFIRKAFSDKKIAVKDLFNDDICHSQTLTLFNNAHFQEAFTGNKAKMLDEIFYREDVERLNVLLDCDVVNDLLSARKLTFTRLLDINHTGEEQLIDYFVDVLCLEHIRHHLSSSVDNFDRLFSLCLEEAGDSTTMMYDLKNVLEHPTIQMHLNSEKGGQIFEKILSLFKGRKERSDYLSTLVEKKELDSDFASLWNHEGPLGIAPALVQFKMALTMPTILNYADPENKFSKLTVTQLLDCVVEEDPPEEDVLRYVVKNSPKYKAFVTVFHYPKIALALTHPEVRQQFDDGVLSLNNLKLKLKGDPWSGLKVAFFGLSEQFDAIRYETLKTNLEQALSDSRLNKKVLKNRGVTLEHLIEMIREER